MGRPQQTPSTGDPDDRHGPARHHPDPDRRAAPTLAETAPTVLSLLAGYVGHRTVSIGLRTGLIRTLADRPGSTPDDLAEARGLDPFYVSVWCRAALAAGVTERDGAGYRLVDHMATLLLDTTSPAFVGGVFGVLEAPEMFGRFEEAFASGERMWWDDTSPEWIAAVSGTGTPFYTRLIPGGLDRVPGVAEALAGRLSRRRHRLRRGHRPGAAGHHLPRLHRRRGRRRPALDRPGAGPRRRRPA